VPLPRLAVGLDIDDEAAELLAAMSDSSLTAR